MKVPQIPNNSLTEEIKEIIDLCAKLIEEYGEEAFFFDEPTTKDKIREWEEKNGTSIPVQYKEWLEFSNYSNIRCNLFKLYGTTMIGEYNEYVDEDLVVIGELIGDGEFLCFSRTTGKIVTDNHGYIDVIDDFKTFLKDTIIRMLKNESGISKEAEDLLLKMLETSRAKKREERREK